MICRFLTLANLICQELKVNSKTKWMVLAINGSNYNHTNVISLFQDEEEGQPEPFAIFKLFFPSSTIDTFEEEGNHVAECTMRGVRISHRGMRK